MITSTDNSWSAKAGAGPLIALTSVYLLMLVSCSKEDPVDAAKIAVAGTAKHSGEGKKKTAASTPQDLAGLPMVEPRFILPFHEINGTEKSGSITLSGNGTGTVFLTERPGDGILFKLNSAGVSEQMIAIGEGSQIRFSGKTNIGEAALTAARGSRLCFRKTKGEWVYVCGMGECVEHGKVHLLGSHRTVDSCLAMLAGDDPILREGAARDLGRLTTPADAPRVVPKLVAMLQDKSPILRRGAAEGLGLIGDQKCFDSLRAALESESDQLVKDSLEESLSLCAAQALMADPSAARLADADAARLFLALTDDPEAGSKFQGAAGRWRLEMSGARGSLRLEEALKTLATKAASTETNLAAAAAQLQSAIRKHSKSSPPGMTNIAATIPTMERQNAVQTPVVTRGASDKAVSRPNTSGDNERRSPGAERSDNDLRMKLCWCPSGAFWMGSFIAEEERGDDELRHYVKMTKGFWLGKAEVTQGEWRALMQTTLSEQAAKALQDTTEYTIGGHKMKIAQSTGGRSDADKIIGTSNESFPMYWVNYPEALEFCSRLTLKEQSSGRLPAGWRYQLPTEAQWEYACRAVAETPYYGSITTQSPGTKGNPALADVAWHLGNSNLTRTGTSGNALTWNEISQPDASSGPRQTQTKQPNNWGIHDMRGNVSEWCLDWHGYYEAEQANDPVGPLTGTFRVSRGGSWNSDAKSCRPAWRNGCSPRYRSGNLGFRVALVSVAESRAQ